MSGSKVRGCRRHKRLTKRKSFDKCHGTKQQHLGHDSVAFRIVVSSHPEGLVGMILAI